jgi:integrase
MRSDFKDNTLRIERSIATLDNPKTDAGFRVIVIDDEVMRIVNDWLLIDPHESWIFPSSVGRPTKIAVLDKLFSKRLLPQLGLNHHVPYDLRHTAITHAIAYARIEDGVSIADVSRWAGHSRVSTTLDNYVHMLPVNAGMVVTMARAYRAELFRLADARAEGVQPGEVEDRMAAA